MFRRKKYRYEYDDGADAESDNGLYMSLPPPVPLTRADGLIALGIGALAAVFAWLFMFRDGLHPSVWKDCAVAAGLRPPHEIVAGVWRVFARCVFAALGPSLGAVAVSAAGKAALGVAAACVYLSFRSFLCIIVRKLPGSGFWNRRLARAAAGVAAFSFAFSDPAWSVFQSFGSQAARTLLLLFTIVAWMRFLHYGRLRTAYLSMFLSGLLVSETPLGLVVLVGFWLGYGILYRRGFLAQVELVNMLVKQNSKWSLTACGAFGLLLGIAASVVGYIAMDGLAANGLDLGSVPVAFGVQYWHLASASASAGGWIIGAGVALMPFVLALGLVCRATDVEFFLRYQVGIVFFAIGCLAYSQLASLYPLWFWTWGKAQPMVVSPLLLCFFALMSSVALLCSFSVLGVDFCCRNNRRLALQFDPDNVSSEAESDRGPAAHAVIVAAAMTVAVAGIVPGRIQPKTVAMLGLMRDYVREIVRESGDAKWIFTDGAYDCAIELESAAGGGSLMCVTLRKDAAQSDLHRVKLSLPDAEDRLSLTSGGPNLLSTWQRDKPERLEKCAVQLCFELWRRSGKAYPPVAGVLARMAGVMSPDEIEAGIARAHVLAERVAAVQARGISRYAGRMVGDLFLFMQWRLSRLARVRAEIFDRAGDRRRAMSEGAISKALDDSNASLRRIIKAMARVRELTMRQMTPREGLQFALVRADFALARRYAEPILDADADDPSANFGMGMSYFEEKQYGRAEEYLSRCLRRNAAEPAVWNNLAVIQLRTGRLEDARTNALKALELIPGSAEVKDTLAKIDEAIAARDAGKDAAEGASQETSAR